ncbi:MAG: helix-turn-helix transcriptional regulator [bacterium]
MNIKLEQFYKKLGKRIKFLREQRGLTQQALAEKSGISLNYLGKIEVAMNKPRLKTIFKIAEALEINPYEFFNFEDED